MIMMMIMILIMITMLMMMIMIIQLDVVGDGLIGLLVLPEHQFPSLLDIILKANMIMIRIIRVRIRKVRVIREWTIIWKMSKNLDGRIKELILGKLVMIQMVRIRWVVQVARLTRQGVPLNCQGAPLTPQWGVAPLAPRSVPRMEKGVRSFTLIRAAA